jgi:hypothetical protein
MCCWFAFICAVTNDDCCERLKKSNYIHFEVETNINNVMRNVNMLYKLSEPRPVFCGRSLVGIARTHCTGG